MKIIIILFFLICISYGIAALAIYGMIKKKEWFFNPKKSNVFNIFSLNKIIREFIGNQGLVMYWIIISIFFVVWPFFVSIKPRYKIFWRQQK